MIAERSEMCPLASLPLRRLTATVSRVVLTVNVDRTQRCSSDSIIGLERKFRRLLAILRPRILWRGDFEVGLGMVQPFDCFCRLVNSDCANMLIAATATTVRTVHLYMRRDGPDDVS